MRAALLLAVLSIAAFVVSAGANAASSGPKPCRNTQLTTRMTHIFGSEGAGSTGYRLSVSNVSKHRCWVRRHLDLQLLSAGSTPRKLPTRVSFLGSQGVVVIRAGHTVSSRLRFSPDIPGKGEPTRVPCEPVAHGVIAFLGPPRGGGVTGPVRPPTSVCEQGSIQERPLG
jgi:uncharacterized protein DUF4232